MRTKDNPLDPFLRGGGFMVLDAGLATSLEARGCDLDDELWSARMLLDDPDSIRHVHLDFLEAGADCIATCTYQATLRGFVKRGLDEAEAVELLRRSVGLAREARDEFWEAPANRTRRQRPLVAASIGPYGAFLADGSEYSGDYGLDEAELHEFHRQRWQILASAGADLVACETIPSLPEARALLRLCDETPEVWTWISFTCRDETHLRDGSRLAEAVRLCDTRPNLAAVGVNCVPPGLVSPLLRLVREHTRKPIAVYPNSGEVYDAGLKAWDAATLPPDWTCAAPEWVRLGARVIGGCCRTGAPQIAALRRLADEGPPRGTLGR